MKGSEYTGRWMSKRVDEWERVDEESCNGEMGWWREGQKIEGWIDYGWVERWFGDREREE